MRGAPGQDKWQERSAPRKIEGAHSTPRGMTGRTFPPTSLKVSCGRTGRRAAGIVAPMTNANTPQMTLRLPYVAPWDWQQFHTHFALRTLRGVECLEPRRYSRSARLDGHGGWFSIVPLD